MFKKLIIAALLIGVGSFVLSHTYVGALARTVFGMAKNGVKGKVPVEWEIQTAKTLLNDLDGKIDGAIRSVARERVALNRMTEEIENRGKELAETKDRIVAMRSDLETNLASHSNATAAIKKQKLIHLVARFERASGMQKTAESVLAKRAQGLAAAELKVDNLQHAKKELAMQIEHLEAQRKLLEAEKIAANVKVDDSEIATLKNLVSSIQDRMDEETIYHIELEELREDRTSVSDHTSAEELFDRIDELFGNDSRSTNETKL